MNDDNGMACIHGIPFYFFYHYVPRGHGSITHETCRARKIVDHFEYGLGHSKLAGIVSGKIGEICSNADDAALFCLPERTRARHDNKYKKFSEELCSILGMDDSFEHVHVDEWAPFNNGDHYSLDNDFFHGKKIVVFTDHCDDLNGISIAIGKLRSVKADILHVVSFTKKYDGPACGDIRHPFSSHGIFLSDKFENDPDSKPCRILDRRIGLSFFKKQYDYIPDRGTITFGRYNNKPIKWEIIKRNEEKVFIMSELAIDRIQYNDVPAPCTWETSSLRRWLNGDFYGCFSEEEKNRIMTSTVEPDKNPNFNTDQGNAVEDKIYILSINEYNDYLYCNEDWNCELTNGTNIKCWLRTCGNDNEHAAFIGRSGSIHSGGSSVVSTRNVIRPVMWITF